MDRLTDRQARILNFIGQSAAREGRPPTVREIAAHFGMASTFGVRRHLKALEKKGRLERSFHAARGIRLSRQVSQHPGIPILGRVAAGTPILAEQNIEGHLSAADMLGANEDCFCLSVVGDSMKDEGILDGGYVIVRPKPDFENGEIGVAIIDGEATVKKLRRRGGMIELIPANERHEKKAVDPTQCDFRYAGEVVAVHRIMKRLRRDN